MRKAIIIFIILFLPFSALAHGLEPELSVDAGVLPGSPKYIFETISEWVSVNLLTLSTKKKAAKKLAMSSERVAEIGLLANLKETEEKDLRYAMSRYKAQLASAEDMVEKVIFLDGKEISAADKLEEETRLQEKFLRELKEQLGSVEALNAETMTVIDQSLNIARSQNKKIFTFMVEKYQATDADIGKHRLILSKHVSLAREALLNADSEAEFKEASAILDEAEKFRKAGLNLEAYDLIEKAKNLVY